ncbi:fimbria/pilus outer membrane usher protein [Siccibacter turicensis]
METGTHFAVAGCQYSTSGYYGIHKVLDSKGIDGSLQDRRRNRMEVTMGQNRENNLGSLMVSAVTEDYCNVGKVMDCIASDTVSTGILSATA